MKQGIIDVGSNSVRLFVTEGGQALFFDKKTTRLGQGLEKSGIIESERFHETINAIVKFCDESKKLTQKTHIFATETARSAKNSAIFLEEIKKQTGLSVKLLSGEEEAELGYLGATSDFFNEKLVIDVGGASTELAIGEHGVLKECKSFSVGAVKATERSQNDRGRCIFYIDEMIAEDISRFRQNSAIAIGGTATSLAVLASGKKESLSEIAHGFVLKKEKLEELLEKIEKEEIEEALSVLEPKRREIIFAGGLILLRVMEKLGIKKVTTSIKDNLLGFYLKYLR